MHGVDCWKKNMPNKSNWIGTGKWKRFGPCCKENYGKKVALKNTWRRWTKMGQKPLVARNSASCWLKSKRKTIGIPIIGNWHRDWLGWHGPLLCGLNRWKTNIWMPKNFVFNRCGDGYFQSKQHHNRLKVGGGKKPCRGSSAGKRWVAEVVHVHVLSRGLGCPVHVHYRYHRYLASKKVLMDGTK